MSWWDAARRVMDGVGRALPPCHVCGAPGVQVCVECHRVGCYRHAYSNVARGKSVCSSCLEPHFPWVADDISHDLPEDWPYNEAPWQILGVGFDASAEEIRQAQRELSRQHHTDVGGDQAHQVAINRAAEEMLRIRQAA